MQRLDVDDDDDDDDNGITTNVKEMQPSTSNLHGPNPFLRENHHDRKSHHNPREASSGAATRHSSSTSGNRRRKNTNDDQHHDPRNQTSTSTIVGTASVPTSKSSWFLPSSFPLPQDHLLRDPPLNKTHNESASAEVVNVNQVGTGEEQSWEEGRRHDHNQEQGLEERYYLPSATSTKAGGGKKKSTLDAPAEEATFSKVASSGSSSAKQKKSRSSRRGRGGGTAHSRKTATKRNNKDARSSTAITTTPDLTMMMSRHAPGEDDRTDANQHGNNEHDDHDDDDKNADTTNTGTTGAKKKSKQSRKRKWKKPKDCPKRPLSGYNLFFAEERKNMIAEGVLQTAASDGDLVAASSMGGGSGEASRSGASIIKKRQFSAKRSGNDRHGRVSTKNRQGARGGLGAEGTPLPSSASTGSVAQSASASSPSSAVLGGPSSSAKRRLGFAGLAKTIAAKWKTLSPASRSKYEDQAELEQERYRRELEEWKQQQEERRLFDVKVASIYSMQGLMGAQALDQNNELISDAMMSDYATRAGSGNMFSSALLQEAGRHRDFVAAGAGGPRSAAMRAEEESEGFGRSQSGDDKNDGGKGDVSRSAATAQVGGGHGRHSSMMAPRASIAASPARVVQDAPKRSTEIIHCDDDRGAHTTRTREDEQYRYRQQQQQQQRRQNSAENDARFHDAVPVLAVGAQLRNDEVMHQATMMAQRGRGRLESAPSGLPPHLSQQRISGPFHGGSLFDDQPTAIQQNAISSSMIMATGGNNARRESFFQEPMSGQEGGGNAGANFSSMMGGGGGTTSLGDSLSSFSSHSGNRQQYQQQQQHRQLLQHHQQQQRQQQQPNRRDQSRGDYSHEIGAGAASVRGGGSLSLSSSLHLSSLFANSNSNNNAINGNDSLTTSHHQHDMSMGSMQTTTTTEQDTTNSSSGNDMSFDPTPIAPSASTLHYVDDSLQNSQRSFGSVAMMPSDHSNFPNNSMNNPRSFGMPATSTTASSPVSRNIDRLARSLDAESFDFLSSLRYAGIRGLHRDDHPSTMLMANQFSMQSSHLANSSFLLDERNDYGQGQLRQQQQQGHAYFHRNQHGNDPNNNQSQQAVNHAQGLVLFDSSTFFLQNQNNDQHDQQEQQQRYS